MDDNLTPGTPSQNDIGEGKSKCNPGQKRPADKRHRNQSTKVIVAIFGALELFALVFWMLSVDVFHNDKTWVLHALFLSMAGSCFLCGGSHLISAVCKRRKQRLWVWGLSALICTVFFCIVFRAARPEIAPIPHFSISLKIPAFPDFNLELTNKLLFVPDSKTSMDVPFLGYLVVPVSTDDDPITFRIRILNDGPIAAEGFQMVVAFPEAFVDSYGQGWVNG